MACFAWNLHLNLPYWFFLDFLSFLVLSYGKPLSLSNRAVHNTGIPLHLIHQTFMIKMRARMRKMSYERHLFPWLEHLMPQPAVHSSAGTIATVASNCKTIQRGYIALASEKLFSSRNEGKIAIIAWSLEHSFFFFSKTDQWYLKNDVVFYCPTLKVKKKTLQILQVQPMHKAQPEKNTKPCFCFCSPEVVVSLSSQGVTAPWS